LVPHFHVQLAGGFEALAHSSVDLGAGLHFGRQLKHALLIGNCFFRVPGERIRKDYLQTLKPSPAFPHPSSTYAMASLENIGIVELVVKPEYGERGAFAQA
jgi:hypothetical protein